MQPLTFLIQWVIYSYCISTELYWKLFLCGKLKLPASQSKPRAIYTARDTEVIICQAS